MASDNPHLSPDVIIIGAGPNGLALALALAGPQARPRCTVLLADTKDIRLPIGADDTRGSAMTRATQNLLNALGCWQGIKDQAAEMRSIAVTDGQGTLESRPVLLSFATAEGKSAAAAVLENRVLLAALREAALATPAITICSPVTVEAIEQERGRVQVRFSDGQTVASPLLVGADGRNSLVRRSAGIAVDAHGDKQSALTFSIHHSLPHHGRAEEHFSGTGVIALLPLPGTRMSLVWGASDEEAQTLMALSKAGFEAELNRHIGGHLGTITLDGERQCYPLRRQLARHFTAGRIALVGDAAHAIHPLAGLGLNLGFKDAACLADCILDAMGRGEDWGGAAALARYEKWRRYEVASTSALMEAMSALFVNAPPGAGLIRRAGLQVADRLAPFKALLANEASGLMGDLPRLMR